LTVQLRRTYRASERAGSVSPGEIIVIYGVGLGPAFGVTATPSGGVFGTNPDGLRW
jgi:hypothetical protein